MKKLIGSIAICLALFVSTALVHAQGANQQPRVLVFFSLNVENDHMLFTTDALKFLAGNA